MAQLEGGSSGTSGGSGKKRPAGPPLPGRNRPAPSQPTRSGPPIFSGTPHRENVSIERMVRSTTPFDMTQVADARAQLQELLTAKPNTSDPSHYLDNMEGHIASPYQVRTPEQAEEYRTQLNGGKDQQAEIDKARVTLEHSLRAQREHALGLDRAKPRVAGEVEAMTWEKYNALPEKQKAAIDFNTALVRAVRRDTNLQERYKATDQEKATYGEAVESMFGEDGGSDIYAPETVALLKQIEFDDTSADLDDFLGLHSAITAADLKHLKVEQGPTVFEAEANPVQLDRYQNAEALATSTQQLEMKLAQGRQFLDNIGRTTTTERNEHVDLLGGISKQPGELLGFGAALDERGQKTLDGFFQEGFEALANKANAKDTDEILGTISAELSPSEMDAFKTYVEARVANAQRFNLAMGPTKGVKYRKPEEFLNLFNPKGAQSNGA